MRYLERGPNYSQALFFVLDELSRRDEVRALTLAREWVSNRDDRALYSAVFDRLARRDIATAVARLELVPAGEARQNAVRAIASVWLPADAPAASRWAASQPETTLPETALTGALSYWVLKDSTAARDFVRTLSGERQTAAATFVAPLLAQNDPVTTLAAAFTRWLDNSPDAARAWIAAANLSPETKARLASGPRR